MQRIVRPFIVISILCIITLSFCFIPYKKPLYAYDDSALRGVFVNTIYGLLTGAVIAGTITIADGDAHGEDWGRNLGIGGAVGAFVGATYGFAKETRHLVTYDRRGIRLGLPVPEIANLNKRTEKDKYRIDLKLFEWRY